MTKSTFYSIFFFQFIRHSMTGQIKRSFYSICIKNGSFVVLKFLLNLRNNLTRKVAYSYFCKARRRNIKTVPNHLSISYIYVSFLGYLKLKKLEVLESTLPKEDSQEDTKKTPSTSNVSIYTDSEKESNDSDDSPYISNGDDLLLGSKLNMANSDISVSNDTHINVQLNLDSISNEGRRHSGHVSLQAEKSDLSNPDRTRRSSSMPVQEEENEQKEVKPRKSILKITRKLSNAAKYIKEKGTNNDCLSGNQDKNNVGDDTETSGYRSNSSSRPNESSEPESDYGYSTITESVTPKVIGLSLHSDYALSSGVLPDESWTALDVKAVDAWSDDDDEEMVNTTSKDSLSRVLYERFYYLNSLKFMNNFVDNFILNLGRGLALSEDAISAAKTQGASIYCDSIKGSLKTEYEIFPALTAAWPNAANQWIIRERKIIQNPRTNFSYQWPTKYMVSKAIGFGCLLIPVGFRPKRGLNPEQTLQWRITFPAAERYLDSCLAHSQMRCYLFTLSLHKAFMENETSKIGIDASHIKNHLFWQCEDNYAKWPEDRLGESLRLFLGSFYNHFGQSRLPNYFVESCNEFKSIPKPILLKLQRKLKDILEAPVMHILHAVDKLKYNKREFYPTFNCHRLYDILTCKNPLHLLNPHLPAMVATGYEESSDSEDDMNTNFWDQSKEQDKHYQWKKERERQIQARRMAQLRNKKLKSSRNQEKQINNNVSIIYYIYTYSYIYIVYLFVIYK